MYPTYAGAFQRGTGLREFKKVFETTQIMVLKVQELIDELQDDLLNPCLGCMPHESVSCRGCSRGSAGRLPARKQFSPPHVKLHSGVSQPSPLPFVLLLPARFGGSRCILALSARAAQRATRCSPCQACSAVCVPADVRLQMIRATERMRCLPEHSYVDPFCVIFVIHVLRIDVACRVGGGGDAPATKDVRKVVEVGFDPVKVLILRHRNAHEGGCRKPLDRERARTLFL
jgi:hypothetical protein